MQNWILIETFRAQVTFLIELSEIIHKHNANEKATVKFDTPISFISLITIVIFFSQIVDMFYLPVHLLIFIYLINCNVKFVFMINYNDSFHFFSTLLKILFLFFLFT
jgi:hypothetical protein